MSNHFASAPDKTRVFRELSDLLSCIIEGKTTKGLVVPFDAAKDKIIIFSDQHKGAKNGADDFMLCEPNYLAALDHYYQQGFFFLSLGDCEELWENTIFAVKKHQKPAFAKENLFVKDKRFLKVFGNHDLYWKNDPLARLQLKQIYTDTVPIYEGVLLQTSLGNKPLRIFCTHGHQGDKASDGNWFSKFFVSDIWAPLQALLKINPNTPAYDNQLKTLHNSIMYEWSTAQENLILITGHTHQPVFESLTHIERLYRQLLEAEKQNDEAAIPLIEKEIQTRKFEYSHVSENYLTMAPCYFNSGCCCYNDGDITGIELEDGFIRLIKWHAANGLSQRQVLEEKKLEEIAIGVRNSES